MIEKRFFAFLVFFVIFVLIHVLVRNENPNKIGYPSIQKIEYSTREFYKKSNFDENILPIYFESNPNLLLNRSSDLRHNGFQLKLIFYPRFIILKIDAVFSRIFSRTYVQNKTFYMNFLYELKICEH